MKTAKEILTEAQALLKRGWCQKAFAENAAGFATDYSSSDAVKFCMAGALFRAAYPETNPNMNNAKDCLRKIIDHPSGSLSFPNDASDTTQDMVLAWVEKAIEECQ
jgi:hypothetical protein